MYSTSELDELFQILNSVKGFKLSNHIGATQHYTCSQIHVCEYVAKEMERLKKNWLPEMPVSLFDLHTDCLKMLQLNIGNIKVRLDDVREDKLIMMADLISFNETHLDSSDVLSHEMLGIEKDVSTFQHDHNSFGGGVALVISNKLLLMRIHL